MDSVFALSILKKIKGIFPKEEESNSVSRKSPLRCSAEFCTTVRNPRPRAAGKELYCGLNDHGSGRTMAIL